MRRVQGERALVQELQDSHRTSVLTLCAMLLVSLASSGYLLLVSQPAVSHYTDVVRDARLLHASMIDQETGLRGWLATQSSGFLEPTIRGRQAQEEFTDELLAATADDPELAAELLPLVLAKQEWGEWAKQAARWDSEQRTDNELLTFLYRGKALFDVYRAADARSTTYAVQRRDDAITAERTALVVALVANLALLGAAARYTARRRRRLQTVVLDPVNALLDTVGALRSGDLTVRGGRSGIRELDAISGALDGFAAELHEARELATAREERLSLLAGRLQTVITVTRETSGSLNVRYVAASVVAAAADLLQARTTLWTRDEDGVFRAIGRSDDPHGMTPPADLTAPFVVVAAAADARPTSDTGRSAYPLILAGSVVGVLDAETVDVHDDAEYVLEALLSTAAAGMESARHHLSAKEQAEIDALTHLPNRRRLEAELHLEWQLSRRHDRPLSFVMLDLDHFKLLNDAHGHLVGDIVLREAAAAVAANLRDTDTAYRYGGEEMAVLLRETDLDEGLVVAERLRAAVAAVTVPGHAVSVTTSVGLAQASPATTDGSALVAAADAALYQAKSAGRNRVAVAGAARESGRALTLEVAS